LDIQCREFLLDPKHQTPIFRKFCNVLRIFFDPAHRPIHQLCEWPHGIDDITTRKFSPESNLQRVVRNILQDISGGESLLENLRLTFRTFDIFPQRKHKREVASHRAKLAYLVSS